MRAELRSRPRVSHKEQVAQFHARVAEDVGRITARKEAMAAALADADRIEQEKARQAALEARYAKNPLLRPIPVAAQSVGAARVTIRGYADPERAAFVAKYLKAVPGGDGEGDQFLGVTVPVVRAIAKQFGAMRLDFVLRLLRSKLHEERLLALLILEGQFTAGGAGVRQEIVRAYLAHRAFVNNWDLIDGSAPHILGADALQRRSTREQLYAFARSPVVWERRMAIVGTFYFIKRGEFRDTIRIARVLVRDPHDLIRKAVGWMLREVGKRDRGVLLEFLDRHHAEMPRVMLRYAIERLTPAERRRYLK